MNIAICDDNSEHALQLQEILTANPKIENSKITLYDNSVTLINEIENGGYCDIAFLDIDMPDINGLDLGKRIKDLSKNTFIVFVTSYPQYAIDAFDCEAFHYLLKPVEQEKLVAVVDKIFLKYNELHKYHLIKVKSDIKKIPIKDIYYVECLKKHILYHLKTASYETVETLSDVYAALKNYGFYQVHQGYLVNFDKVDRFEKQGIILDDGRAVMMSVRKRKEVLLAYTKYLEEHI